MQLDSIQPTQVNDFSSKRLKFLGFQSQRTDFWSFGILGPVSQAPSRTFACIDRPPKALAQRADC